MKSNKKKKRINLDLTEHRTLKMIKIDFDVIIGTSKFSNQNLLGFVFLEIVTDKKERHPVGRER